MMVGKRFVSLTAAAFVATVLGVSGTAAQAGVSRQSAVPTACVTAIADARQAFSLANQTLGLVQHIAVLAGQAAQLAARGNTAAVASLTRTLTAIQAQLTGLSKQLAQINARFNANAARCR